MKTSKLLLLSMLLILVSSSATAQNWAGILKPTYGTGACTGSGNGQQCAIDWTQSGIPGGIPTNRTQCGSTIQASTYGNGSSDATSGIQSALNSCGANQYVLLGPGTFRINTSLSIPSNVTLRGSGTRATILSGLGTGNFIQLGSNTGSNDGPSASSSVSITNGATAGSTSIVVSSASGISVNNLLMITELNDSSYVTITTTNGTCTWCDMSMWSGTRVRGQIVLVTSVSGTTIGISPGLYTAYAHTPLATLVPIGGSYVGLESLQLYDNNSGYTANVQMSACLYCWVKGIESNYSDADHLDAFFSYRGEVRDSYFTNSYIHHSGSSDSEIDIAGKSSGFLVENNILERLHSSLIYEWGNAGNVYGYNYDMGNYDDTGDPNINHLVQLALVMHGAHPQFNLWEGNVTSQLVADGFWGSSSHSTAFRNWSWGTTLVAPYNDGSFTGRKPINWAAAWYPNQNLSGFNLAYVHSSYNFIGNVSGSAAVATVGSPEYTGGPSACTACDISPSGRNYSGTFYAYDFGYGTTSDSSGQCSSPVSSCTTYATTFLHGNYDTSSGHINWNVNFSGSQTLPASFYKSSKPSWWGTMPWPAIGPDVTTGDGPGGHVDLTSSNPAEACYNATARDANGIKLFDPTVCYATTTSGGGAPNPPSGLSAVVQ